MHTFGIDASLNGTGIALPDGTTHRITIKNEVGAQRLLTVRNKVAELIDLHADDDAQVRIFQEDYAYSQANAAHAIGELGGVLRVLYLERGWRLQLIAPQQVKKWATGKGAGDKSVVSSAVSAALGYSFKSNDEVDAFVLRDIGEALLGNPSALGKLPQYRLEVLEAIRNPKPKKGRK